ncbi:MAG: hypothetical protein AABY84_01525 [Candidatus Firestonebacteria bacterium]
MNIRNKIIIVCIVCTIVSICTAFLFLNQKLNDLTDNQQKKEADLLVSNLAAYAKISLINNDDLMLLNFVDEFSRRESIIYALVINNQGKVIAHTQPTETGKIYKIDFLDLQSGKTLLQKNEYLKQFTAVIPFYLDEKNEKPAGIAAVKLANKHKTILEYLPDFTIFILILLAFSILSAILIANSIRNPILKIKETLELATEGIFNQEIKLKTKGEVQELAILLNKLTNKLTSIQNTDKNENVDLKTEISTLINAISDIGVLLINDNKILLYNNKASQLLDKNDLFGKHILDLTKDKQFLELVESALKEKNILKNKIISKLNFKIIHTANTHIFNMIVLICSC